MSNIARGRGGVCSGFGYPVKSTGAYMFAACCIGQLWFSASSCSVQASSGRGEFFIAESMIDCASDRQISQLVPTPSASPTVSRSPQP